ncbi:hypothetical protein DPMN_168740 [Dreissena polymorpha]|uniref:Uncharacterized protein n=1 Tax=Dreissena polymorpha TaxID=45954 RepID=A0A9D4F2I1_DREPO|nr:hypothetical protein DPMN_168740 [Dreissena polymorpha]
MAMFHEDWPINVANIARPCFSINQETFQTQQMNFTKNVTSRVLKRFSHKRKNIPRPGVHFYKHWTINKTFRVLTRKSPFYPRQPYIIRTYVLTMFHKKDNKVHVFQPTRTILNLVKDIIGTCVLTKFLEC